MWFALSMLLLFVGWCWYDSSRPPLTEGAGWSNESEDEGTAQLAGLRKMLDKPLMSSTERSLAWHEMGFMTPDHLLPSTSQDWESAL
jgi:hypothetical protein